MSGSVGSKAPVFTHEVIDPRDGDRVAGRYQSARAARRWRDKLDLRYGAIRYRVRAVPAPACVKSE